MPDGKTLVFTGNQPGHAVRLYVQAEREAQPRGISPEGVNRDVVLSPNGDLVANTGPDRKIYLFPVASGDAIALKNTELGEVPSGWSADGKSIYVYRSGEVPANVFQVDISSGQRKLWKQLVPGDSAGIDTIRGVEFSAGSNGYVYGYIRTLSDLYLVEGVK